MESQESAMPQDPIPSTEERNRASSNESWAGTKGPLADR